MPALCCNAAEVSVYKWFIIHTYIIMRIYFKCSIRVCFTCIILYILYFKLPKMFYPSQFFINSMFAFLLQELDLLQYIIY